MGADQSAMLEARSSEEAAGVTQELHKTLGVLRSLAMSLRSRGRVVWSPEVPQDYIDAALHSHLRSSTHSPDFSQAVAAGTLPPLVWRLGHGQYLIGEDR